VLPQWLSPNSVKDAVNDMALADASDRVK